MERVKKMCMKSKEKIEEAMLSLMKENSFEELTISEICGKADVARRTFYNNFSGKEEVLREKCVRIIEEMTQGFGSYEANPQLWVKEGMIGFFETCYANRDFFQVLMRNKLCYIFENEMYQMIAEDECLISRGIEVNVEENLKHYAISYYVASAIKFYKIWAETQFKEDPEQLSELFRKLVFTN